MNVYQTNHPSGCSAEIFAYSNGAIQASTIGRNHAENPGMAPCRHYSWNPLPGGDAEREDGQRKAITKYGQVYLDARERLATRTHGSECKRCGPGGKPALPGSPLSKGHQYPAALRKVGKEILRDLWLAAREDALNGSEDCRTSLAGPNSMPIPFT